MISFGLGFAVACVVLIGLGLPFYLLSSKKQGPEGKIDFLTGLFCFLVFVGQFAAALWLFMQVEMTVKSISYAAGGLVLGIFIGSALSGFIIQKMDD